MKPPRDNRHSLGRIRQILTREATWHESKQTFAINERGETIEGFHKAFTLIELLVVMAVIGILVALTLPTLAKAKSKAAQTTCLNNLKQLATAMEVYTGDHDHTFPGMACHCTGYEPEDWIYWRTNSLKYPPFESSPIVASLGSPNRALFRCPSDSSDRDRIAQLTDEEGPYLFSYSLTGYGLDSNNINIGISSVVETRSGTKNIYLFKEDSVRSPVNKIMLAEQPGSLAKTDSPDGVSLINDGRWIPSDFTGNSREALTIRHSGKATVIFVDGHASRVTPAFGADTNNTIPGI